MKSSASTRLASPGRRRLWFRVIAVTVPLVNLALLEFILRIAGFGHPTSYFLKTEVNGRPVFIENQEFSRRYFPPGLEREPQPVLFPAGKPPGTIRVFVFGESAAMGDPEPAFGFARIAEVMLREAMPGRRVEIINVAVTAINSHVIREIAKDCADKQGDYWLVYMGNNEVVGPFGAGTIFGDQTPGLGFIRASVAFKSTRLGQLFDALRFKFAPPGAPKSWEGMEMFLNQQVAADDPRMARVYSHFETNLREILEIGVKSGATVLVGTVASNVKDCPPFASHHGSALDETRKIEWQKLCEAGITQEETTNHAAALGHYEKAAALDGRHAELQFRIGRCRWALGRFAEAKSSFELARDLDVLRFRADSRINATISATASNLLPRGVQWVDVAGEFNRRSAQGIAGDELLHEHVHPNFDGNYWMARAFVERILGATHAGSILPPDECARRLAFTDFNRFRVLDEVRKRLQQPPFTRQLDHELRDQRFKQQLDSLQNGSFSNAVHIYEQAIARSPDDWVLRENFATLLQDFDRAPEAETHWRRMVQLLPHSEQAWYGLANVLDVQGKAAEAAAGFREALRRRPGSIEARNGLALALANQGRVEEALTEYQRMIRLRPDFVEARVNLGQLLAQQGRETEALTHYLEALRLDSNHVALRINLGKLLSTKGQMQEAVLHYREALRLKPDNVIAHYNLGNSLNALGDSVGAVPHFTEAVRLRPGFVEARYNLGLGLARQNRNAEALEHLSEAARLRPSFVEARFNHGVALAKASRYDEAIHEFRETLRLNPDHAMARKLLEQAEARRGGGPQ